MNKNRKQLVVLAGGQGSRMASAGFLLPKLLLKIQDTPLIEIIINEALIENFTEILWCLGHAFEEIENYFELNPRAKKAIRNVIFVEPERRGTLGALIQARERIDDDFCLIMGDLLLSRTNLGGVFESYRKSGEDARLLVKYTDHPQDSDLVTVGKALNVEGINPYPHQSIPKLPIGNAGAVFLKKHCLPEFLDEPKSDVFKNLIPNLISRNFQVGATFHQGLIRDVGTPDRLDSASEGVLIKSKLSPSKGVFFDRDGTLNVPNGHINSILQIDLYPDTSKILFSALKHFSVIGIVTNQPVIARGEATKEDVEQINSYVLKLAGIEDESKIVIKVCPHHPEKGFTGEIPELKSVCHCRKPASGMLLEALNENYLRSNNTIYVGDSKTDLEAAQSAGIRWVHILNEESGICTLHPELIQGSCMTRSELLAFFEEVSAVLC